MFERFTERARQVIVLAQDAARERNHDRIGTEHLLIGLVDEEEGIAARVLASLDMTPVEARKRLDAIKPPGDTKITGQIPFTERAKHVCEMSLREALSLGHNYIGTEHILLGVIRENEGVGNRILLEAGIDSEKVRRAIVRLLSGGSGLRSEPAPAVTIKLSAKTAAWLREHHGQRPVSERESAEVYEALDKALRPRRAA